MDEKTLKAKRAEETRREINAKRPAHAEKIENANNETLKNYAKFYGYIGTMSGGAIVLSVSFLTYIKNIDRISLLYCFDNINVLQLSWIAFIVTIILTLIYSKKHLDALYWETVREYAELNEDDKKNVIELIEAKKLRVIEGTTEEEKKTAQHNKEHWEKQKGLAEGKRKSAESWNQNSVKYIHISFIAGVILLVLFGITTLGI